MQQITESIKHQFAKNLTLDEQEASKLTKYVTNENIETERAQFESMGRVDAYVRDRLEVQGVGSYGVVHNNRFGYADANASTAAGGGLAAGSRGTGHTNAGDDRVGLDFTKYDFTEIKRREINAKNYVCAITMDRADKINILIDPASKYTRIVNDAMGKAKDQAIIGAFSKIVRGGIDGTTNIYFNILNNVVPLGVSLTAVNNSFVPISNNDITRLNELSSILKQASEAAAGAADTAAAAKAAAIAVITDDNVGAQLKARFDAEINAVVGAADAAGKAKVVAHVKAMARREKQLASAAAQSGSANISSGGLTVDKLILARQLLNKGTFNAGKKMYLVVSEQQIADLLHHYQIVSSDYNNVKALVEGSVDSFMGFQIIKSEWLGGLKSTAGDHAIRECYAFTEDSIRFATVKNSKITRIDELERHHYAPSIYHSESFGASRASEGGIVCIKCLEPTHAISNIGDDAWVEVVDSDTANRHRFKALYASVVPSGNLTWDVAHYADNQVNSYGAAAALAEAQIIQVNNKR